MSRTITNAGSAHSSTLAADGTYRAGVAHGSEFPCAFPQWVPSSLDIGSQRQANLALRFGPEGFRAHCLSLPQRFSLSRKFLLVEYPEAKTKRKANHTLTSTRCLAIGSCGRSLAWAASRHEDQLQANGDRVGNIALGSSANEIRILSQSQNGITAWPILMRLITF